MSNIPKKCRKCKILQKNGILDACINHTVYLDSDDYMQALDIQNELIKNHRFCKCGKVIEHKGTSKWCSLWCPEYKAYLASKPKSKLDLIMEKKHRAIDNTLFAQAMGVIL